MANRPKGYGMTAELANKKAAKFDADLANEAMQWIVSVLQTGDSEDQQLASEIGKVDTEKDVQTPLKNGVILCHLVNLVKPGSVKKINTSEMAFKQMENIGNFLDGCEAMGANKVDLFQTVDLFEKCNIPQKKKAAKFDADLANETLEWIVSVLRTGSSEDQQLASQIGKVETEKDVHTPLKDGVILCHLVNVIKPGSVKKVNSSKMAFKQMENIANFLTGCEGLDMNKTDLFQTVDLYESGNIPQVINGIVALGRKAQKLGMQGLGPKESTANKREFTEEQLRAGEGVIGLQAGSNKGASQAGQSFGKSRMILD